jgi:hypothetical protein
MSNKKTKLTTGHVVNWVIMAFFVSLALLVPFNSPSWSPESRYMAVMFAVLFMVVLVVGDLLGINPDW